MSSVKTRYRFRLYPTPEQEQQLARTFGCVRVVYNHFLRLRTDAYREGKQIGYHESSALLSELKKTEEYAWLNEVSCVPLQQSLRHLQTAFVNFFEKRTDYPSFKRKHAKQSAEYTRSAFRFDPNTKTLEVAKLGKLKVRWSRDFTSLPTTVTITKRPSGRYFVTLCLDEPVRELPKTGKSVGVDLGINRLATLSTGEHVPNPRHLHRMGKRLARLQRRLSRRQKTSNRYASLKRKMARLHERIGDCRSDALHQLTTRLVRDHDLICVEDLNVCGLVQNHCLARSLSDAALGTFRRLLEYKCLRYGKTCVAVDRFFPSSKTCSACGHILAELPLSCREWDCPECKTRHDRDHNAAVNILAVGHTESQNGRGGTRRPVRASARKGKSRRNVNHQKTSRS
jgi:putative transposase